jgi:hypothetical protein
LADYDFFLSRPGAGVAILLDHDAHCSAIIGDNILGCLLINDNCMVDANLLSIRIEPAEQSVIVRSSTGDQACLPLAKSHGMRIRG